MSNKPLHVRVAEALGWSHLRQSEPERGLCWVGVPAERRPNIVSEPVWLYDTDWRATGPLIERLKVYLYYEDAGDYWVAQPNEAVEMPQHHFSGMTPLEAVCNLILALSEAGRLFAEERADA